MSKRPAKSAPPKTAKLFDESHSAPPPSAHLANIDGASRGNPGPAAYAVILRSPDGTLLRELGKYIGRTTNNVAEYYALIAALDYASTHEIRALRTRSDSELLVRQMQGRYKVKSADLQPLFERAKKLARSLDYFSIEHVPREANRDADRLANRTLDSTARTNVAPREPNYAKEDRDARRATAETRASDTVKARYAGGVLVPESPLDIAEGSLVELEIRRIPKT